jgi:predicted nucleic acid-binding protein
VIEVIDASVAIKWFVRKGERGLQAADGLRKRVLHRPDSFSAPLLFLYEVHAALCQRIASEDSARSCMRALFALGIRLVRPDRRLLEVAGGLAREHGLTAYDAAYAAVARHLRGRWITFDATACERLASTRLVRLLPLE